VVLVGLPGAGKSTFARALSQGGEWEVISQDALGSKGAVESAVVNAIKAGKRVLVDRCNVRVADRKRILDIGMIEPSDAVAVHLTTAPEACVQRVAARTDHPTIPYGHGRSAVASMAKALERRLASGRDLASLREAFLARPGPFAGLQVRAEVIDRPDDELRGRIVARTRRMLSEGLLEEARQLAALRLPGDLPAVRAVGYREALAWVQGGEAGSLADLAEAIDHASWRLVGSQRKWFRRLGLGKPSS
jgi:predicted kinase